MDKRTLVLALSMASLGVLVNPTFAGGATLEEMVERIMSSGDESVLPAAGAESFIGFPRKDVNLKQFKAKDGECVDGKTRHFSVVLDDGGAKTGNLWFYVKYQWPGNTESHNYLTTIDGELLKVTRIRGKRDDEGNSIQGSGQMENLDIDSPEVQAKFKKELNFWVKGTGRKKAKAATKPADKDKEDRTGATRG